jgi:hypothetical protein
MIIPFPIAFLTGSVAFDVASRALSSEALYTTAGHLMIAGAVVMTNKGVIERIV